MGNDCNLQNAKLQEVVYSGKTHKNADMGIKPKRTGSGGSSRSRKRGVRTDRILIHT